MPVIRPCLGGHENIEWPCNEACITSCGRQCGRLLKCTNHKCSLDCHAIETSTDEVIFLTIDNCFSLNFDNFFP